MNRFHRRVLRFERQSIIFVQPPSAVDQLATFGAKWKLDAFFFRRKLSPTDRATNESGHFQGAAKRITAIIIVAHYNTDREYVEYVDIVYITLGPRR